MKMLLFILITSFQTSMSFADIGSEGLVDGRYKLKTSFGEKKCWDIKAGKYVSVDLCKSQAFPRVGDNGSTLLNYNCELYIDQKYSAAELTIFWVEKKSSSDFGKGVLSYTVNEKVKIENIEVTLPFTSKTGRLKGENFSATIYEPFGKQSFYGRFKVSGNKGSLACSQK